MTLYNLAKRIARFVWNNGDWFDDISDRFDAEGDLVTETYLGLCGGEAKEIAEYLKGMSTEYRNTFTSYAKRLYENGDPRMDSKTKIAALEKILDINFDEV